MCRIVQTAAPYFKNPYPYESKEGQIYLRFVLREQQKRNTVFGYLLTRLVPIPENGERIREELARMIQYLDPSINLVDSEETTEVSDMARWYKETFGVPGTPEFEENIRRINQSLRDNNATNDDSRS